MAHGPWKNPLHFGGNPDHVMLGWGRLWLWLGGAERHPQHWTCLTGSAALVEVCALLNVILVKSVTQSLSYTHNIDRS